MRGKRDDTADAIRYFLNRYRAEVLRHPVAFEEVGRPKRYTFADEVAGLRPSLDIENGSVVRIDGDDFPVEDFEVTVENQLEAAREAAERKAFDTLFGQADSTVRVVDRAVRVDDLRDAIHALRREEYADDALYAPGNAAEALKQARDGGAGFFVGSAIEDDLADQTRSITRGDVDPRDFDTGLPNVEGFPVTPSKHVPDGKGVFVDASALAPPVPGVSAMVKPFVVRDPKGVVAIERVDTDFEWCEGGR